MGNALLADGDAGQARTHYESALRIRNKILAPRSPLIAGSWMHVGNADLALKNFDLAAREFQTAFNLRVEIFGQEHVSVAEAQSALAEAVAEQGDLAKAQSLAERALQFDRLHLPSPHPQTAAAEAALGSILLWQGKANSALPLLKEAYLTGKKIYSAGSPKLAAASARLTACVKAMGKESAALKDSFF